MKIVIFAQFKINVMNRFKVLLFSLVVTTAIVSAQPGIRFSVFANPCINWLVSDIKTIDSKSALMGFDAGMTLDKYFADNYAFSTGISIGTLGGNLNYEYATGFKTNTATVVIPAKTSVKFNLQYITIPLGLKFKTKEIGYFTYFAHLGLTSQINIKATGSSNDNIPVLDGDNISEEISMFNMAYHFGGGIQYSLGGNTALVLGATLTNGFVDVTQSETDKITTSSLAIRLGILF